MRILVCFPYWDGDRMHVERTAHLAMDLLSQKSDLVEFALVARFDAQETSQALREKAQAKGAKLHLWRCNRMGEGFPGGCNELAYGILSWVPIGRHVSKEFPGIDAILIFEGDCVFTRKDWDVELMAEWKKTRAMGKLVCGTVIGAQPPHCNEHINAVALWAWDISHQIKALVGGPYQIGWDNYHGASTVPVAYNSPLFQLDYCRPTITEEQLYAERNGVVPLVYHGVKDGTAVAAVRKHEGL